MRAHDHQVSQAELDRRLLELLLEGLEHLGGGRHVLGSGDEGGLAHQRVAGVGQAGLGEGLLHVAVLGHVALGAGGGEAVAQLGELGHGHAGVFHHQHEGRGVHPLEQLVDDDLLVGIHGGGQFLV